ncbi:MAG: mechanosensitive ion channel [Myxococcales bacterium]|nr:mechanosensitive ion channel [Myxococcales bacterium]
MNVNVSEATQKMVELLFVWAPKVIAVLVALFVGWLIAAWAGRKLRDSLDKRHFDPTLGRFFANILKWLILVAVVLGCLGVFGIQTSTFAVVIGSAGLAVGLAFQGTLSNFAAGVMLLVFRPFKIGDYVKVAGTAGTCEEIELFTSTFRTPDNRKIVVPNTQIFGAIIENVSAYETRRVDIAVGADYSANLDETRRALESVASKVKGVLSDPAPQVFLNNLGDSSINWQVRIWCKSADYWDVWQAATKATKEALDGANIGIPFPQMDVHLDRAN